MSSVDKRKENDVVVVVASVVVVVVVIVVVDVVVVDAAVVVVVVVADVVVAVVAVVVVAVLLLQLLPSPLNTRVPQSSRPPARAPSIAFRTHVRQLPRAPGHRELISQPVERARQLVGMCPETRSSACVSATPPHYRYQTDQIERAWSRRLEFLPCRYPCSASPSA